ncbi:Ig-like domain-containing protein [Alloalcanivorax xenomutans]|uniref:Ig-like domain-containing protein n=1 Tax=Alloalcanivorax xenomutans TaxID=1094342 RepID=UPI0009B669E1|nr:Ig-like domain-containing protein [Alloalcanivorax xenomutans]ARB46127.1 hypothetical protein P40_12575 [Alloalcanivorax xenomutans]
MITLTLKRGALLISSALILSACGGGGGSDMPGPDAGESKRQSLLYAYPDNGQTEVPTPAPVVLRFSSAVTVDAAEAAITLHEGDASGPTLAATFSTVDGEPRGLVLTPDDKLKPLTDYTVVIKNLKLEKGTAANQVLGFTTRPLHEGPRSLVVSSDDFVIERRIPDGGSSEPVMDFSTFRFQFSQPIDPATVHYGDAPASSTAPADNVGLYDSQGNLVDAVLVVNDRYMTVDPNPQSDDPEDKYFSYLTPGETYTLRLGDGITSVYGETFGGDEIAFTPKDSSPRGEPAVLVQKLTTSGTSRLTGRDINQVPVNGTLLGENANITQATNDAVEAELADVTVYPDVTPIRLPRGTVLDGSAIEQIMIGGKVPAGFGSGPVKMVLLSDATGYLVPNPYNSVRSDALRIVRLLMDVGISTDEPRANGAFTQDVMHIELVGVAEVDTTEATLNLDAVGVVEPHILGQEYGYGVLSFQLQSYPDQQNPPAQAYKDETSPTLQSWVPGDKADLHRPGDPIVLNYDEPISASSVSGQIQLFENGQEIPTDVHVEGAAIVINPRSNLKFNHELDSVQYNLNIGPGISDINNNKAASENFSFNLPLVVDQLVEGTGPGPVQEEMRIRPPIVTAVYPGFPCVTDPDTRDIANDIAGLCIGSLYSWTDSNDSSVYSEDSDYVPVSIMPGNRPIIINFSKDIDIDTVRLGDTFTVHKADSQGNPIGEQIEGQLDITPRLLKFYPDMAWEVGELYVYTLTSNGDMHDDTCTSQSICSTDTPPLPLQTQLLGELTIDAYPNGNPGIPRLSTDATDERGGGKPLSNFFRGGEESKYVLQNLVNAPTADTNANFFHDVNHDVPNEILSNMAPYTIPRTYAVEEPSPDVNDLDPHANQTLSPFNGVPIDLNGVRPIPNSSKVLSLNTAGSTETDPLGTPMIVNYGNIGCGPKERRYYANDEVIGDPMTGAPQGPGYLVPANCPDKKFVYLTGALNAEITDEFSTEHNGIKVMIWPGQVTTTNLTVYTNLMNMSHIYSYSGPQILRMRYERDNNGSYQPITGYIRMGDTGAILEAEVNLYVDAPYLENRFFAASTRQNLHSYPITMTLSGPINFLDDGRMLVEQFNKNDIKIDLRAYGPSNGIKNTSIDLLLPYMGTRISYIGQPIK